MSNATETPLFLPSLISPALQASLPANLTARPLHRSDYTNGHLDVLRDLAHVGDISEAEWTAQFDEMRACAGTYYIVVFVDNDGRIVASGSLVVEKKFLFKRGLQGHIEDIVIAKEWQGKKLGVALLGFLSHVAKEVGCYKTILDCSPENKGFYEKCGYSGDGKGMQQYFSKEAEQYGV